MIAITAIVTELKAVTAYPYPIRFVQPDKTTVLTITMKGDERIKWAETEDGYSLIYNDAGYFCYATKDESGNMVPSQHIATDIAARSAEVEAFLAQTPKRLFYSDVQVKTMIEIWEMANEKNLKANEKTATTGRVKFPVILASFSNKSFTKTKAQFNNLLNQVNYNSTGSVYDFYNENSYGKMQLQFVVVGPVQLSQNIAYYGNNTNGNSQQFAREAVTLADDSTDFSQFDNDGNGYVDGVHIFFAGFGEESGGGADCIWSHRGTLSSPVIVDGKRLRDYSCSPEMRGSSGSVITNIGVICHELGHVFGSPDFYDTDYGSSGGEYPGTGTWDIMASGSWNNNGVTPAHHNPYSKCYIYGWATPRTLTQPEAVVMLNAEEYSNSFYRVETTTANEYFLLENRQKFKFDANIPGSGLVIYRVHKNGVPGYNVNTTHPQRFYVVSATSTSSIPTSTVSSYGSLNSTSCAFGNTKFDFTDATTPSSKSWAGGNTNKPINGITKVARNRTVCFLFKGATINPGSFQAEASSAHAVRLSWQLYNYKKVLLVYSSNGVFGTPQGDVYNAGDNISGGGVVIYQGYSTSFDHTGLSPQTLYKYKIFSLETDGWTTGVEASATTLSEAVAIPYTENFDADSTMPARWTCDYEYENYQWVVANSSNGSYTPHSQNNYLFSVAPSTSYNGTTTTIISVPVNTTTVQNAHISFWLRNQRRLTTTDILTVKCRASATSPWEVLATYESGISNWREEAFNLPNSDYVQVAFESTSYNGRGVGIDDVTFAQGSVG
ncbi:MAG: M6 family metalloprotease domain-containing protein, partial [Bacteroidales bacterium]|nr:M6 family metalloprotease domain-containing protein [Bacteroidales bacterium]